MAAPTDYLAELLGGVSVLLTSVLGFIGVRMNNRIDALDAAAVTNAEKFVSREELLTQMNTLRDDRQRMHEENKGLLTRIFDKLDDHSELKEKVRRNEQDIQNLTTLVHAIKRDN
jgi:hypothetical protein